MLLYTSWHLCLTPGKWGGVGGGGAWVECHLTLQGIPSSTWLHQWLSPDVPRVPVSPKTLSYQRPEAT